MNHTNSNTHVVCLAAPHTTRAVQSVARKYDLNVLPCSKLTEAVHLLQNNTPVHFLVAALGTNQSNQIFDAAGDRSSIITLAKSLNTVVIIYSHTACRIGSYALACRDAGANFVCHTEEALSNFLKADLEFKLSHHQEEKEEKEEDPQPHPPFPLVQETGHEKVPTDLLYPSLLYRRSREAKASKALRPMQTSSMVALRETLEKQLTHLRRPLLRLQPDSSSSAIRCVFVSDTHNHHRLIDLPPGDLLLHAGDATGNYGKTDITAHFEDYVSWLKEQANRYQYVVFIAGNHDTLLDGGCYNDAAAKTLMRRQLPQNCIYLENQSVALTFPNRQKPINIYGCPATTSRLESMGKRYYSDAFERTNEQRIQLWKNIPEHQGNPIDILLTHTPPTFDDMTELTYCGPRNGPRNQHTHGAVCTRLARYGDPLLTKRLNAMAERKSAPKFHCFGHDHDFFGIAQNDSTTFFNGAQEEILRMDLKREKGRKGISESHRVGLGCPLVFDC